MGMPPSSSPRRASSRATSRNFRPVVGIEPGAGGRLGRRHRTCGRGTEAVRVFGVVDAVGRYRTRIGAQEVDLPLVPIADDLAIALLITVDHGVRFAEQAGTELAALLAPYEADVVVSVATMGIPLAIEVTRALGLDDYLILQKTPKIHLPGRHLRTGDLHHHRSPPAAAVRPGPGLGRGRASGGRGRRRHLHRRVGLRRPQHPAPRGRRAGGDRRHVDRGLHLASGPR